MDGSIYGLNRLIDKYGSEAIINTKYKLKADANVGNTTLSLEDSYGIRPGHVFTLATEYLVVAAVNQTNDLITASTPLTVSSAVGTYITSSYTTKARDIPRPDRVLQDYLEYIRKVIVPLGTMVNYGSYVVYDGRSYYVTGFDESDIALTLRLQEVNLTVAVARMGVTSATPTFNGFSYVADPQPAEIYSNIPACGAYSRANLSLGSEPGMIASSVESITIPDDYSVMIGDIIVSEATRYRVLGIDRYRLKNLQILPVSIELLR